MTTAYCCDMVIKVKNCGCTAHHKVQWVEQKEQLGTGHAVLQALPAYF